MLRKESQGAKTLLRETHIIPISPILPIIPIFPIDDNIEKAIIYIMAQVDFHFDSHP